MIAHRVRWWMLPFVATLALAAEWLRVAEAPWAWAAAAAALATVAGLLGHAGAARRLLAALLALVALVVLLAQWRLDRIERHWAAEREAIVAAAGERLRDDLHAAFVLAEGLAADAAPLAGGDRAAAFAALDRLRRRSGLEVGVAILEHDGTPWAWAGAHRIPPVLAGDSIGAAWSQYYVALESRRHSARGRTAVSSVLVWAHPAVPARAGSLAERFRARTQVALDVVRPEAAPESPDVFDYCEPTTAGPRCLFSVVPRPPDQADARGQVLQRGGQAVAVLLLLAVLAGLVVAELPAARWALVPLLLWLPLRAPVGPLVGLESLFSPATYYFRNVAPLSGSAGLLALSGAVLTLAAVHLWQRRLPRRWWTGALGLAILLGTPYAVSDLSRGIAPPAGGTPIDLWVTWEVALFLAGAGLVVLAAALLQGDGAPRRYSGWAWLGMALAVLAAVVGIAVWRPRAAWPEWFPLLWLPALLVARAPLRARQAVVGVALAAGSLAALLTWSGELRGRMAAAQREVFRLGEAEDPVALGLVDLFGDEVSAAPEPQGAAELYALWRGSLLAAQRYPVRLALWERERGWYAELPLDSVEVGAALLDSIVQAERRPTIVRVAASPGPHYVLRAPVGERALLVAVVGPATQLVSPSRLGRLLEPSEPIEPPYRLFLSPPRPGGAEPGAFRWRREGWTVQASRALAVGGATRTVSVQLPLRAPERLILRGAVLLVLDGALLALLWLGARFLSRRPLPAFAPRPLLRSFRGSLAVTLSLFFLLPAVLLSLWGFVQLASESRRAADVLVTHRMLDALHASGGLQSSGDTTRVAELASLSERVDAHLGFYVGGRLAASSSPVLTELGVLPPLMDDVAFRNLALQGRLEAVRDGPAAELAERIGYRLVRPGPPSEVGVLALPQRHAELASAPREDLALALLLTLLVGLGAALLAARGAARALARPVATLQRAALELGAGGTATALREAPGPAEFEPVFGAFQRMEADLRAGREALEAARRRTERVLATVATGVVALDGAGRVLLANRQAEAALGTALEPGAPFVPLLPAGWQALAEGLGARGARATGELSLEVFHAERRYNVQVAPLGPDGGAVLALTDVTELSRAERVLAWGEMARQVAHEIKNPLTPMRLGIQHLQRAWRDRRAEYSATLDETTTRILAEIDRLDQVARAFSRFGVPATAQAPIEPVDLAAVSREVRQLYALSREGAAVHVEGIERAFVRARKDEVKEVLVNLLENARNAGARRIVVAVRAEGFVVTDDGAGIAPEVLPRVFEPHFSTTTSGSGLGLSIVQRLVEGWGGRVSIASEPGRGTTVTVSHVPADG